MSFRSISDFDENKWVIHVHKTLKDDHESEIESIPICIFNVPKILLSIDPDSYIPQEVAIGPYSYWRPELYEMERYKLAATKRTNKEFLRQGININTAIDELKKLEIRIRAYYHKFLTFGSDTLALMMAIDASFLLEFLSIYAIKERKIPKESSSRLISHLFDYAGTKAAHNAILRDMVKVENQIPLFVLRKILELQYSSVDVADDMLQTMLIGFCEELSPFTMTKYERKPRISESYHLLDYLYDVVVPKEEQIINPSEIAEDEEKEHQSAAHLKEKEGFIRDSGNVQKLLGEIWKILSNISGGPIKKVISSKPVEIVLKLPWKFVHDSFLSQENKEKEQGSSNSNSINKPPLLEEITVPSVSELIDAKVHIRPTKCGNVSKIEFNTKTVTLHLPPISLDANTEVIMKNLMAYEASNASGMLVFTRYTELMNGIIDTEDDVKLLRRRGIILNRLKSDAEVANMWNRMSGSIRLTKAPSIDNVIKDVNKYYNGRWKVKMRRCMKIYVYESWRLLTVLAAILLLFLMAVESGCSVFDCPRILRTTEEAATSHKFNQSLI